MPEDEDADHGVGRVDDPGSDLTDGDSTDGDSTDGDLTDGDSTGGDSRAGDSPDGDSAAATIGQGLAAAAAKSGLGKVADLQAPSGRALLAAMGGIRGLIETILPGLVFLVLYTFTKNVPISVGASVAVAVVFTIIRLATRTPVTQAVAGLIGVGLSAILALITGRGQDNFVVGLFTNGAYGAALLISVLIRWPLIGLAAGYLMGDGLAWRSDRAKFRAMQVLTLFWLGLFVARLAVELPLYFAANVEALAIAKLLMGVPLYASLVLLSWLMIRSLYPSKAHQEQEETASGNEPGRQR